MCTSKKAKEVELILFIPSTNRQKERRRGREARKNRETVGGGAVRGGDWITVDLDVVGGGVIPHGGRGTHLSGSWLKRIVCSGRK